MRDVRLVLFGEEDLRGHEKHSRSQRKGLRSVPEGVCWRRSTLCDATLAVLLKSVLLRFAAVTAGLAVMLAVLLPEGPFLLRTPTIPPAVWSGYAERLRVRAAG